MAIARETDPAPTAWRERVRIVVWLRGEQDHSTAEGLAARLETAAGLGKGNLVVDLSQVQFIDGAIVRVLMQRADMLTLESRRLRLRAPPPFARRVLELCGLVDLVEPGPVVGRG